MNGNIGKYEIKEAPGIHNEECFSVQEICDGAGKKRTLYTGSLEACAVLAVKLSSGEVTSDDIVSVTEASISPYFLYINGIMYTLDALYAADDRVYLGLRSRYDNHGHYDNSDGSLMFVSENHDVFELLSGKHACSRKEIQESGYLTEDEFNQFVQLNLYAPI